MTSRHATRATVGIATIVLLGTFSCNAVHRDRSDQSRSSLVRCSDTDDGRDKPWGGLGCGSDEVDAGTDLDAGSGSDASTGSDASSGSDASIYDAGSDASGSDAGSGGPDAGGNPDGGTGSDGGSGGPDAGTDAPGDSGGMDAGTGSDGGNPDAGCPAAAQTFTDTVTVEGKSTGTAAAGPYKRGGVDMTTSPAALRREQEHAKHYDGPTKFTATYTIVLDDKGVLDKTRSTVTFKTVNYTDQGRETASTFTTNAIGITDVTLTGDCPPKLKSFKFSSTDWYPATATGAAGLSTRTLSGSMDVITGKTSYVAKYTISVNGAIYTYNVSDTKPPAPAPQPPPPDADPEIYAPLVPDFELAGPGTFCDSSSECDFLDGLSCIAGYCE